LVDDGSTEELPPLTSGSVVLGAVLLTIGIVLWSVQRFPGSLWRGGQIYETGTIAGLLAYGGVAYAVRGAEGSALSALSTGTVAGVALAALEMLLRLFAAPPGNGPPESTLVHYVGWVLLIVVFGSASVVTYVRMPSMTLTMLASLWAAVLSNACLSLFAFVTSMIFVPRMSPILFAAYEASGMTDPRAYMVRQTLEGTPVHLMVVPLQALVIAAIVAGILGLFRTLSRPKTRGLYR
jgi:hypothetical protein